MSVSPSKVSVAYPPTESTHIIVSNAIILGHFVCVWVCSIERRLDFFVKALAQEDLAILVSWCLGVLVWVCSSSCKDLARGSAGSKTPGVGTICGWSAAGRRYSADRGGWCVYGLEHKGVEW